MGLRSESIPNKALNGREVLECAVADFRAMLERDCAFLPTIAYRKVAYAWQFTFHGGYPHQAHVVKSRTKVAGIVEGEAPLVEPDPDAMLVCLEREVALENPNIARVHHDLPIRTQERAPERVLSSQSGIPGEPVETVVDFPSFVNRELRYDKEQFPAPTPPVDRDVSEVKAKELGVKRGGLGLPKK